MKKTTKPRLERPKKAYSIDQCALYRLRGINQLIHALSWNGSAAKLRAFAEGTADGYHVFSEVVKGKARAIQAPYGRLDLLQRRIATLLRRVAPPAYRQSGVRGRSIVTNGEAHLGGLPGVKIDVKSFYASTSFGHVFRFFSADLKCSGDIAGILASLCCFFDKESGRRFLPTGGAHSEVVAFFTHKPLFDDLHSLVSGRSGVLTTYIDDIVVSMPGASRGDLTRIQGMMKAHGLPPNPLKCRLYGSGETKLITGVVVKPTRLEAPNSQHLKLREDFARLTGAAAESNDETMAARTLIGRLSHIANLDARFVEKSKGNSARLRAISRGSPS